MKDFIINHKKFFSNLGVLLIFLFIPLVIYSNILLGSKVYGGNDLLAWINNSQLWKDINFSAWQKYYAAGFPSSLIFSAYPIAMLLSGLSDKAFMYIYYCAHIAIGSFFFYKYLKEIKCSTTAAFAVALIYEFSIHISGLRKDHMVIITSIVMFPVALYFIQKYFNTKHFKWLMYSLIPMVVAIFGHSQTAFYLDVAIIIYMLIMAVKEKINFKQFFWNSIVWGVTYMLLIPVKLIGMLMGMAEYADLGAVNPEYGYFISYALHPIKLLYFLFPNLFGEMQNQVYGYLYSAEIDYEIFLGFIVALIVIFCAIFLIKKFYVKLSLFFIGGFLIYSVCPHIPYLNRLIFSMPILGGFRCASRALFVVIFFAFVLLAIAITELAEPKYLDRFCRYMKKAFSVLMLVLIIVAMVVAMYNSRIMDANVLKDSLEYMKVIFAWALIVIVMFLTVLNICKYLKKNNMVPYKYIYRAIAGILVIITFIEVYPYVFIKREDVIEYSKDHKETIEILADSIGNYKFWDAYFENYVGHKSIANDSDIIKYEIPVINSYMSLNNPRLYRFLAGNAEKNSYNDSGVLIGSKHSQNVIKYQNNFLSMMGIKYILDNYGFIDNNGSTLTVENEEESVLYEPSMVIPENSEEIKTIRFPFHIESNELYKVSFETDAETDTRIIVDFYGENYDFVEQEIFIDNFGSKEYYSFYINSGDTSNLINNAYIRFFTYEQNTIKSPINVYNLKIQKLNCSKENDVYIPFFKNSENMIYENTKANDILHIPNKVVNIEDDEYVFDRMFELDLANVSYIENAQELTTAIGKISNIDFGEDYITADIIADGQTFVNFAQCYFSGWQAYVDGEEVPVHRVNGIIMGAYVPEGTHTLEFKFVSVPVIIAYSVAAFTVVFWIIILIVTKVQKSKKMLNKFRI